MTAEFIVIGNPIKQSRSPQIHRQFATGLDISMDYESRLVPEAEFETFVEHFFKNGGKGANVTLPFKERAYAMADNCTDHARAAGAANTLFLKDGILVADNTDGRGMVNDITNRKGWCLNGKRVLFIGAGGAVRGVIQPVLEQHPESVSICNRTYAKAEQLAEEFDINALAMDKLNSSFDVVISGSSAGLSMSEVTLPPAILGRQTHVYDMIYGAKQTPFLQWAAQHKVAALADGLGMLVDQAAESFFIWHGVMPDVNPVYQQLR